MKTFAEQSRDVFTNNLLDDQKQFISSTGFNNRQIGKDGHMNEHNKLYPWQTDETLNATSRRYGTKTDPFTHPANHSPYKPTDTTFRVSYINPKRHPAHVYRDRTPDRAFSGELTRKFHDLVTDKQNLNGPRDTLANNCSGYTMNSKLWDGTSWATERNFHADQMRTQYRKQFNQPKPFHKRDARQSPNRVAKKALTYEPTDMRVTGFGGKDLNLKLFEENGKHLYIDGEV